MNDLHLGAVGGPDRCLVLELHLLISEHQGVLRGSMLEFLGHSCLLLPILQS